MNFNNAPEYQEVPKCPICESQDYDYIYKNFDGEICGCSDCVKAIDAYDYWEEIESEEL